MFGMIFQLFVEHVYISEYFKCPFILMKLPFSAYLVDIWHFVKEKKNNSSDDEEDDDDAAELWQTAPN